MNNLNGLLRLSSLTKTDLVELVWNPYLSRLVRKEFSVKVIPVTCGKRGIFEEPPIELKNLAGLLRPCELKAEVA